MLVNVILATWVLIHNTCIVNAATHKVRRDSDDCVWDQGDIIIIPINTVDADSGDKYLFVEADLDGNLFDAEGASGLLWDGDLNFKVRIDSTSECKWVKGDIFFVPIKASEFDDEDFFTGTTEPYVLVKVDDDKQASETCDFIDGEDDNDCIFANSTANVLTFPDITYIAIEDFIVQM
eukprot:CFRG4551T1